MTQDRPQDPARGQKNQAIKSWLIWYFRQPFVMIVWFMETFAKNRDRVKATLARQSVSKIIKTVAIVTFFGWLMIAAFLSNSEDGDRLTCAAKSLWWGLDEQSDCEPQPWQQPATSSGGAN